MKVKVLVTQPCPTLRPHGLKLTSSCVRGIIQAGILEWIAIPFSRGSSPLRDPTRVSRTAGRLFTTVSHKGSPMFLYASKQRTPLSSIHPYSCPTDLVMLAQNVFLVFSQPYPSQPNFILSLVRFIFAFRHVYVNDNKNNNETKKQDSNNKRSYHLWKAFQCLPWSPDLNPQRNSLLRGQLLSPCQQGEADAEASRSQAPASGGLRGLLSESDSRGYAKGLHSVQLSHGKLQFVWVGFSPPTAEGSTE